MNLLESVDFFITVTGEKTGETFSGGFSSLKQLSHRAQLTKDRIYRELLGSNPEFASVRAKESAELLSELKVSLVKTPQWWQAANDGLDLVDDKVIMAVWDEVMKIRLKAFEEMQAKAKDAEEKLKQQAVEDKAAK